MKTIDEVTAEKEPPIENGDVSETSRVLLTGSLSECEAGCNDDTDCSDGYSCFKFERGSDLPFCAENRPRRRLSFCYPSPPTERPSDLPSAFPSLIPSRKPSSVPTTSPVSEILPPLAYVGENKNPMEQCEGDCDDDKQCNLGLVCMQRDNVELVPGCAGEGDRGRDYCYEPEQANHLVLWGDDGEPTQNFPLGNCQGDCDSDSECAEGLFCYQRNADEPVPGCVGSGQWAHDYCFDPNSLASGSSSYIPGQASVDAGGLLLSEGLTYRILANAGFPVRFDDSGLASSETFHELPDGGAVFEDTETGGWIYVSNSEANDNLGGVGALTFDRDGRLVDYKMLLTGTSRNCGGGKTWWNTWLSCEEIHPGGQIYEVDPFGRRSPRITDIGGASGNAYESVAYDNRDTSSPVFYATIDAPSGQLVRFKPNAAAVQAALASGYYADMLHSTGTRDFLVLNNQTMTFEWTTDVVRARESAFDNYQGSEGIDVRDGRLYFTAKWEKLLLILDLDALTYTSTSTTSGAFQDQPDQVARLVGEGGDDILYFCEDGGDRAGVHGRDASGRFYTILEGRSDTWFGETTGLAFSPDNMFMYVSYQQAGRVIEVRRVDGLPFGGQRLDIKYHAENGGFDEY